MPRFDDFPPEISLQIFPHIHLKDLISVRGVCKRWMELVSLADIHPTRLALLKLYQKTVHDPLFLSTSKWTLENLRPFDREAYIDALLAQHNYIPDDFQFWILEWPARAAIACAWPGLPGEYVHHGTDGIEGRDGIEGTDGIEETDGIEGTDDIKKKIKGSDGIERISGCNFLGRVPPLVHRITIDLREIGRPLMSSEGDGETDTFSFLPYEDDPALDYYPDTLDYKDYSDDFTFDYSGDGVELHDPVEASNDVVETFDQPFEASDEPFEPYDEPFEPYDESFEASDEPKDAEDSDPEEYYQTHAPFIYSRPRGDHPVEITFPALIVWERDDARQTFLALAPNSPFAVYLLRSGHYESGESRQYTSWISWLEAQLRKIHRQAKHPQRRINYPLARDANGKVVPEDVHFTSRMHPLSELEVWTAEDEAHFNAAA
ncbi:hypothetical protein C8R46DRAFT_611477 [Mycena filopes]|nr:hypothetical protein C8R46DRAFT_611477 [Mycena filopes]